MGTKKSGINRLMSIMAAFMLLFTSILVIKPMTADAAYGLVYSSSSCDMNNPTKLGAWQLDNDSYLEDVFQEDPSIIGGQNLVIRDWGGGDPRYGCDKYNLPWQYTAYDVDLDGINGTGINGHELLLIPKINLYTGPDLAIITHRTGDYKQFNLGPFDEFNATHNTNGVYGNELVVYRHSTIDPTTKMWLDGLVTIYDHRKNTTRTFTIPTGCGGYDAYHCTEFSTGFDILDLDGVGGDEIRVRWKHTQKDPLGFITYPTKYEEKIITDRTSNYQTRGAIDSPADIKGYANISGWGLDDTGIAKVEVLVDGTLMGNATYGASREDIYNAYPQYLNHNAGFSFTLNTYNITNGAHTLTVRGTSNIGLQTSMSKTINIYNLPVRGYIDTPIANSTLIGGKAYIKGWVLDPSGVSKIEVLVDGVVVGDATATYGTIYRPDVYNAYPEYNNLSSGFSFSGSTTGLANGAHTLTIRETGGSGIQNKLSETIYIAN